MAKDAVFTNVFSYGHEKVFGQIILSFFTEGYDEESMMIDSAIVPAHSCAAAYSKRQEQQEGLKGD
jgi:hypothetical protein